MNELTFKDGDEMDDNKGSSLLEKSKFYGNYYGDNPMVSDNRLDHYEGDNNRKIGHRQENYYGDNREMRNSQIENYDGDDETISKKNFNDLKSSLFGEKQHFHDGVNLKLANYLKYVDNAQDSIRQIDLFKKNLLKAFYVDDNGLDWKNDGDYRRRSTISEEN